MYSTHNSYPVHWIHAIVSYNPVPGIYGSKQTKFEGLDWIRGFRPSPRV